MGSTTITISRYIPPAEVGSSPSAAIEGYEEIGGEEREKERERRSVLFIISLVTPKLFEI